MSPPISSASQMRRMRPADAGANLLVVPELAVTGYGAGEQLRALAEPADGAIVTRLAEIALTTGVAVIAGFAERAGDLIYNSAAWVNGADSPLIYRKSHLYGDYERGLFTPEPPTARLFTYQGIRCGMLICYDVEFPENVRRLAQGGADVVLVPTALPAGASGSFIADHMIQTRAFENQVFVAYVNHCGSDPLFSFAGRSRIAAPDGSRLAAGGAEGEELLFADIDPAAYAASRGENTYLADLER